MDNQVIGILGGGQLGRMLVEAANRMNIQVRVLDPTTQSPAKQISNFVPHIDSP
ncbi:phosphoribosylaminoimidazole carboxylase ade2, partial [Coemansia sp. RSA 2702]